MKHGTIETFSLAMCRGVIKPDDGSASISFKLSEIGGGSQLLCRTGQRVQYSLATGPFGKSYAKGLTFEHAERFAG